MIGEPEVIVRAHVENAAATRDADVRILRRGDDAFGFVKTLRPDLSKSVGEALIEFGEHVLDKQMAHPFTKLIGPSSHLVVRRDGFVKKYSCMWL